MKGIRVRKIVALAVLFALGTLSVACQGGEGLGLGVSYPGRFYGPMDSSGSFGGGPVWN